MQQWSVMSCGPEMLQSRNACLQQMLTSGSFITASSCFCISSGLGCAFARTELNCLLLPALLVAALWTAWGLRSLH